MTLSALIRKDPEQTRALENVNLTQMQSVKRDGGEEVLPTAAVEHTVVLDATLPTVSGLTKCWTSNVDGIGSGAHRPTP